MKRIISVVLAVCMAAAMGVTAFAANTTYTGFYQKLGLQEGYNRLNNLTGTAKEVKNNVIDLGTVYAADKKTVSIGLYDTMFVKSNGTRGGTTDATGNLVSTKIDASDIRLSKMTVSTSTRAGSKGIKKVLLDTKKSEIRVELADEYVATKSVDFEVAMYLSFDGKRNVDTGITVTGTMYNREVNVYAGYDYVDLSDQNIAVAEDYNKEIEAYLGNGVSVFARFFKGNKYYGITTAEPDNADLAVFDKYPSIRDVITLKTVGLNSSGNTVRFEKAMSGYYIYDKDLKYLGRSEEKLPYSTKYYFSTRRIDTGAPSSSSSSASSSSSSSSSSSTSSSTSTTTAQPGDALTLAQATTLFNNKLNSTPSGQKTLSIVAADKSSVSLDTLKGLQRLAERAGVKPTLIIDQKTGNTINTRLYITPASATKSIDTFVARTSKNAQATEAKFDKWYRNNLFVVGCGQKGNFGMTVEIAVKVPKNVGTSNLYLYSYDSANNSYQSILNPNCRIDSSGYLHFNTKLAGDIVISDGPLKK